MSGNDNLLQVINLNVLMNFCLLQECLRYHYIYITINNHVKNKGAKKEKKSILISNHVTLHLMSIANFKIQLSKENLSSVGKR